MKAVVIERPHEVRWQEVETPRPGPDDVLVASHKAGVCRTDLEMLYGELTDPRWVTFPVIPGHEWVGSIAEVGANVGDFRPGDRVVCEGMIPCNHCRRCKAGETQICENYDQLGFSRGGGYGEFVLVPRHVVHRLPAHVSDDAAVLVEPASCVLRALERTRPQPGETVAVIGIGTLGALALMLARLWSPGALVAYGVRDEELELARRLGATETVNVAEPDRSLDGLDVVVETAGSVEAVDLATRIVRPGGRVVLLGVFGEGKTLELEPDRIVLRDVDVIGSCSYTTAAWSKVLRVLTDGLVDFEPLVTHRFPAADFAAAFELMDNREGTVAKIVLEHDGAA